MNLGCIDLCYGVLWLAYCIPLTVHFQCALLLGAGTLCITSMASVGNEEDFPRMIEAEIKHLIKGWPSTAPLKPDF